MRSNLIAISGFLFFLIAVFPSLAGEQAPISLDRLPDIITGAPNHRAEFTEERRVLLLTEPVRLQVDGEWVTVSLPDQNTEMRFNMTDDPLLHGLLFSLQSLLNGEPGRLAGIFTVEAWGGAKAWTLRLKPSGRELAERVRVMRVTGETHWIRTIELWETSGDYLIMTIGSEVTE
jgi:hypothetical protein